MKIDVRSDNSLYIDTPKGTIYIDTSLDGEIVIDIYSGIEDKLHLTVDNNKQVIINKRED